jgi:glycerol-3-phosphate acyltransferase PlsY
MEGRNVLVQTEEDTLQIYSALNSLMHAILFVSVIPKYFKLFHSLKRRISHLYFVILSCIVFTRHERGGVARFLGARDD